MTNTSQSWGEPAPEWLRTSETYGEAVRDWRLLNESKWTFVTHVPHRREYLAALRRKGLRGFPYVTFYQDFLTRRFQGHRLSEHLDWIEIDEHGQWKRTGFWESEDAKNMYCTCANVEGYVKSLLEYVEHLMDLGAGGIFLDNVHPNRACYGPQYGAHEHLYGTQVEAFTQLLRKAREVIRWKDPEGALLINSADPATLPEPYWEFIDCEMAESYICTWVSTERWGNWARDWNGLDRKIAGPLAAGKQVCCLSYLGHTPYPLKDDAFFCYASARLMNLIWTAGGDALAGDEGSILYRLRLGPPTGPEMATSGGLHYRFFENGFVAVNPTGRTLVLTPEPPCPGASLRDVYSGEEIPLKYRKVKLPIPAQSGRVYLFEPSLEGDEPARTRYVLTLQTEPPLGKVQFRVDGLPLWTHAGRWTTEYVKGPNYGQVAIDFDEPGIHTVEVVDVEKKELLVARSYEAAYRLVDTERPGGPSEEGSPPQRLGRFMDPANPTQFASGRPYRFQQWAGGARGSATTLRLRIDRPITLVARYEQAQGRGRRDR